VAAMKNSIDRRVLFISAEASTGIAGCVEFCCNLGFFLGFSFL
jgi:hypothetical protein